MLLRGRERQEEDQYWSLFYKLVVPTVDTVRYTALTSLDNFDMPTEATLGPQPARELSKPTMPLFNDTLW